MITDKFFGANAHLLIGTEARVFNVPERNDAWIEPDDES